MIFNNYYNKNSSEVNRLVKEIIDKLGVEIIRKDEMLWLLDHINFEQLPYLQDKAMIVRKKIYGNKVYIRGLIEISNICKQDCFYCGIRKSNINVQRYRLDSNKIENIIYTAVNKGYNTIVLQGGEDEYFNDEVLTNLLKTIKTNVPNIAITLSLGERSYDSYHKLKDAGANRYLLRHESASSSLYAKLHPSSMKLSTRLTCLQQLKDLGYQTGAGFMVHSPFQTNKDLVEDFLFIQDFQPEMIGIGPYLNHIDTPFKDFKNADINYVMVCYCIARLLCCNALLPSTTATSSLDKKGRINALKSGCNVIMINLSEIENREKYSLYQNKTYLGDESNEYIELIERDIKLAGLEMDFSIGNYKEKGE